MESPAPYSGLLPDQWSSHKIPTYSRTPENRGSNMFFHVKYTGKSQNLEKQGGYFGGTRVITFLAMFDQSLFL